jgi:hypothetical protein
MRGQPPAAGGFDGLAVNGAPAHYGRGVGVSSVVVGLIRPRHRATSGRRPPQWRATSARCAPTATGLLHRPPIPASIRSSKACRCPVRCRLWLGPKPEMFTTGDVPPLRPPASTRSCCGATVPPAAHQAARENDPAKVLQMVEAGGGLRADELSGRDQVGQAAGVPGSTTHPAGMPGSTTHRGCGSGRTPRFPTRRPSAATSTRCGPRSTCRPGRASGRPTTGRVQPSGRHSWPVAHLTTREHNRLTATQAQTVIAAAILRHLHAVVTTGQAWDPDIATRGRRPEPAMAA